MKSRLEQYIKDHRDEFDSDEPDPKVWDQITNSLASPGEKKSKGEELPRLPILRWTAAAAILVLAVCGIWYFTGKRQQNQSVIAAGNKGNNQVITPKHDSSRPSTSDSQTVSVVPKDSANVKGRSDFGQTDETDQNTINEEMYHYAKIVELRQKELKKLEKDEPLLYRQFSGDVNKLDSVYRSLKKQLEINPNRQQLLEAMIQNLQLQIALLNHQLDIIKQINYSKKSAYEKAYKPA